MSLDPAARAEHTAQEATSDSLEPAQSFGPAPASPSPSLSRSSSSNSFTSESSFDPHAPPAPERLSSPVARHGRARPAPIAGGSESGTAPLGLRELARMAREDRRVRKAARSPTVERGPIVLMGEGEEAPDRTSQGAPPGYLQGQGRGPGPEERGPGAGEVFAADVLVRGWKIVGGKGFDERAKVGAYVVYDIEIITRGGGSIEILRRYTDFVNLRKALKSRYPTHAAAIPRLPGKNHMSKFSDKLLEDRRPRLQRFLRTVLLHPELGRGGVGSVTGEWVLSGTTHSGRGAAEADAASGSRRGG